MNGLIDLDAYLQRLIPACEAAFGGRLLYLGLQGSYLRGEANENSDLDIMAVIDRFSVADMDVYREILARIGHAEKACGFICGREELARWSPLEIRQLKHSTKDLYGALSDWLPEATRADAVNYVKLSLGNLYHELCHRYIHAERERNAERFRGTCKGLFFLIRDLHDLESGEFILTKRALREAVSAEDREMLEMAELPDGFDFDRAFAAVFLWCRRAFVRTDLLS